METTIKVMQKLLKARKAISETKMNKEGKNTYSNYAYFTPDQVSKLVFSACLETKLLTLFSLKRNELGYFGELIVADTDSGEQLVFTQTTDVPEIKATNLSQKIGGMVTYTQRYLESSTFGIVDNNLDFDNQDNRVKPPKKQTTAKVGEEKKMLNAVVGGEILAKYKAGEIPDIKKYLEANNFTYTPAQLTKFKK